MYSFYYVFTISQGIEIIVFYVYSKKSSIFQKQNCSNLIFDHLIPQTDELKIPHFPLNVYKQPPFRLKRL